MTEKNKSLLGFVLLTIATIILIIYPLVMLANLMSVVAKGDPSATSMEIFSARLFFLTTTIYPITVIVSFFMFRKKRKLIIALLPYFHLLLIYAAYLLWA